MKVHNGDVNSTEVVQGLFQMGGYWGGTLGAKVIVVVSGLLVVLDQGMVWPLVGL